MTVLGCERNNIDGMFEHAGLQESETLQKLVIQDVGGTAKAVEEGIRRVEQLLPWSTPAGGRPSPPSTWCWPWSAAAAMASPACPPTPPWAGRWTCW